MKVVLKKHRMASRGGHTGLCLEARIKSRRIVDRVKCGFLGMWAQSAIGL